MKMPDFAQSFQYADKMLLLVSRTFALNINVLSGNLRKTVLLAYLYLRIADTIEDDPELSVEENAAFSAYFQRYSNRDRMSILIHRNLFITCPRAIKNLPIQIVICAYTLKRSFRFFGILIRVITGLLQRLW